MAVRADAQWIANLSHHRVGRLLASHLASVDGQSDFHNHDCSVQEALSNERVLVYALARSVQKRKTPPCGLSSELPLYIAVLNLSGERALVHSDSPSLMRSLCTRSNALHRKELDEALNVFESHAASRTKESMKFVILTYSMPWQAGTDAVYWHLSACSVDAVGDVDLSLSDRIKHFSSTALGPCAGKSVMHTRDACVPLYTTAQGTLALVGEKQISDFCDTYSATCLDTTHGGVPEAKADGNGKDHGAVAAQLRSVADDLQRRRKADQDEIKELKGQLKQLTNTLGRAMNEAVDEENDLKAKHKEQFDKAQETAKEALDLAQEQCEALRLEVKADKATINQQAREIRKTNKLYEAVKAKQTEADRQSAAKDALHNAALSQHVANISRLEAQVASKEAQIKTTKQELEKAHASALQKERETHAAALKKVSLALESKERICNQLSENNERRDVEVESHKTYQAEQDQRIADLQAQNKTLSQKLSARPKPPATRDVKILTRKNASTSTHQCASTQTDAPEETVVAATEEEPTALTAGPKPMVDRVQSPSMSYQAAIDMLQELVITSGAGQYVPQAMMPVSPYHAYPRPLPFPHFMPGTIYQEQNGQAHPQPRYSPVPQPLRRGHR